MALHWRRMRAADVSCWSFSVSISVKLRTFFGSLHWPSYVVELGAGGISYVELLILYESWATEADVGDGCA